MRLLDVNEGCTPSGALAPAVWSDDVWRQFHAAANEALRDAPSGPESRFTIAPLARRTIRAFSSSFFIVTRFLPKAKRRDVEIVYANVRYPDEVVDSLPLSCDEQLRRLDQWQRAYEAGLIFASASDAVRHGVEALPAAFAEVVRTHAIPAEYYLAFLDAMRRDVHPRGFPTMDALVEEYVYGSAVVVGYWLAYVFQPAEPHLMEPTLGAARELGIALQMTNFLRDVAEDLRMFRVYLPEDRLRNAGIDPLEPALPEYRPALSALVAQMAAENDGRYAFATESLRFFAPDTRSAVRACIDVYRLLNRMIMDGGDALGPRRSVAFLRKFRALPMSKYWVLPYAYWIER